MPRPFAVAGFTVFLTILFLANTETGVMITAFCAFFIALVVALLIKSSRQAAVFPLSMLSGALACVLLLSYNHFVYEPIVAYDGDFAHIKATLTDFTEERYGNYYCQAQVNSVNGEETDFKIRLVFSEMPDAQPYDIIEGNVRFYRPGNSADEFLSANKAKGIFLGAYFTDFDVKYTVQNLDETEKPFMYRIVMLRRGIRNAVYRALPDETGSLAVALLIGDKSAISDELYDDFVDAGIIHLICVSGFHLTFWANVIIEFLRRLHLGIKTSSVIAAFGVLMFMFVAGFTPSVVRSGIMTLIFLLSNVLSRKRDSLNSLGFALLAMALYNPLSLTGIGLQLSALSTLGIIIYNNYFAPKIDIFIGKIKRKTVAVPLKAVLSSVCLTAGALIPIQPISLINFGRFGFVAFISNILVTWASCAAIVLSALSAVLSLLVTYKYNFIAVIARLFLRFILWAAKMFSSFVNLIFKVETDSAAFIIALVLLFCAAAVVFAYKGRSKPVISLVLCFSMFFSCVVFSSVSERKLTRVRVVDNGNSVSVCVSKNGESVLLGCGGDLYNSEFLILNALQEETDELNALLIPDSSVFTSSQSVGVIKSAKPDIIYSDSLSDDAKLIARDIDIKSFADDYCGDNISVTSSGDSFASCSFVETDDASFLVLYEPVDSFDKIPPDFIGADVLITRGNYPKGEQLYNYDLIIVNAENFRGVGIQNEFSSASLMGFATAECGDILIRAEDGSISVNRN